MGPGSRALAELFASESEPGLLDAALALAKEEAPGLDDAMVRARLDAWAEHGRILGLSPIQLMFEELGFRGDEESYYAPHNSLVHRVVDHRRGLPISLSVVFVEMACRMGWDAYGVGFPGHFVAAVRDGGVRYVDCFTGGTELRPSDLQRLLSRMAGTATQVEPWMLAPATAESVTLRMLANLQHAYARQGDLVRAITCMDRSLVVRPQQPELLRERGLAHAHLGLTAQATTDLEGYLGMRPDASDRSLVQEVLRNCAGAQVFN
jgi:regulator of sirC expression with transglutaminase-like and TPR domain